jgi:hypothetical protein
MTYEYQRDEAINEIEAAIKHLADIAFSDEMDFPFSNEYRVKLQVALCQLLKTKKLIT